jgi:glycosyltransferase involved in cell wall biosynthesis
LFIPGPRAWRRIALDQPDLLYIQQPFGTGRLALKAARKLKIPLLGTNHTAVSEFIKYNGPGSRWIRKMALKYYSWYYNHCQLVTGPSQWVHDSLAPAGLRAPYRVISNPLDFKVFFPVDSAREATLKRELGFSDYTLSFAGRLASEKKVDILIRGAALVKEKFPVVNLVLAGNGRDLMVLKKLVADLNLTDNVKFLGRLSQRELAKVFQASAIFVTASTSETQGMTVLQAMACGRAVIGVRSLALPEYINGHNGLLVEPDNPQALAAAIVELLSDKKWCAELGQGGYEDVQKYSRARIADTWENIFQSAISTAAEKGK